MDAIHVFNLASAGWLGIQSLALMFTPSLLTSAMTSEIHHATVIETYLARSLGFALLTLAGILLLTPTDSSPSSDHATAQVTANLNRKSDYSAINTSATSPTTYATTIYYGVTALYCYVRWTSRFNANAPFLLGAIGNAALASIGVWCIMFGESTGRVSKRTGADKRLKGFPFGNVNAYDKKEDRRTG